MRGGANKPGLVKMEQTFKVKQFFKPKTAKKFIARKEINYCVDSDTTFKNVFCVNKFKEYNLKK
jgi:hypothetical protein